MAVTRAQESTSEDVNFYYAMTMWAIAVGNSRLEGLGRIQTNILTKSVQRYFLLKDDNDIHPPEFARNKVCWCLLLSTKYRHRDAVMRHIMKTSTVMALPYAIASGSITYI